MDYSDLAKKTVELRIAARAACMCEERDKALLSLKTKVLFVLSQCEYAAPRELTARLRMQKPNLTVLARELENDGLIARVRTLMDLRGINYTITDAGKEYLDVRMRRIAERFHGVCDAPAEIAAAADKLEAAIDLLSFIK